MNTNPYEISSDEKIAQKELVRNVFEKAIAEVGAGEIAHFGGFIEDDSNLRGTQLNGEVKFNEKFLNLTEEEIQRWGWHEAQHALTDKEALASDNPSLLYSFVMHPSLRDLHNRMQKVYEKYKLEGFPFYRELRPVSENYGGLSAPDEDYFHPFEILSLLRGYQCYLNQISREKSLPSDPSEFIEAFTPEDLTLLEPEYRIKLGKQLLASDPHILDSKKVELDWD